VDALVGDTWYMSYLGDSASNGVSDAVLTNNLLAAVTPAPAPSDIVFSRAASSASGRISPPNTGGGCGPGCNAGDYPIDFGHCGPDLNCDGYWGERELVKCISNFSLLECRVGIPSGPSLAEFACNVATAGGVVTILYGEGIPGVIATVLDGIGIGISCALAGGWDFGGPTGAWPDYCRSPGAGC